MGVAAVGGFKTSAIGCCEKTETGGCAVGGVEPFAPFTATHKQGLKVALAKAVPEKAVASFAAKSLAFSSRRLARLRRTPHPCTSVVRTAQTGRAY